MDKPKATSLLPPGSSDAALYERRSGSSNTEEVRLVDIWFALVRRRLVIAVVTLLSTASGLVYVISVPRSYEYTTVIEIGTRHAGGRSGFGSQTELIETPETVRTKITSGYIAQVLQAYLKNNSTDVARYGIKVDVPKNSQVLILRSVGTAENEPVYVALHDAVVDRLRSDHLRIQNALQKDLETRLKEQERILAELRQQAKTFDAQLKRLEGKQELPARELSYLTSLRLADNQRAQSEMVSLIDNIRQQQTSIRETGATVSAMRSLDPVGLEKKVMMMLSGFLGLFLGILMALFIDFAVKARDETIRRTQSV